MVVEPRRSRWGDLAEYFKGPFQQQAGDVRFSIGGSIFFTCPEKLLPKLDRPIVFSGGLGKPAQSAVGVIKEDALPVITSHEISRRCEPLGFGNDFIVRNADQLVRIALNAA